MIPLAEIINTVIEGDCVEIMKKMPDKCVDLVFADPPFNAKGKIGWYNRAYQGEGNKVDTLVPEKYEKWCRQWFKEARRIGKKLLITPGVRNIGLYPNPYWCVVISKPSSPSFNRLGGFNCWEPLFIYDKPLSKKRLPRDVVVYESKNFIKDGRGDHPCPDSFEMIDWILDTWLEKGGLVLDPFLGSGTTAICAKKNHYQFIGIEISPKYCEIARKRIAAVTLSML